MAKQNFSISQLILSPPDIVYSIIADYKEKHQAILPKPPFVSLKVEMGGVGAGTEMMVQMKMFGKSQMFRAIVTEPGPGRVLIETTDTGYITTFTIEPRNDRKYSYVTFTTELAETSRLAKKIEFWLTSKLLRPVYKRELEKLTEMAKIP